MKEFEAVCVAHFSTFANGKQAKYGTLYVLKDFINTFNRIKHDSIK